MPTIRVEIPSRNQLIEFDEGTPESVIQEVIKREFPRNGNDVAYEVAQLPGFSKKISDEDFVLYEDYLDKKKTDYVSAFAGGVSGIAETVGKGVAGIFQLRNLDPQVAASTAIEGAAQGTRDLYGMIAQSTDPTSYMFKFTNWLNGTGTVQDRKAQWIEANEFTERSERIARGEEAIVPGINPAFVNADVRNAIGLIASPDVLIPGLNVSAVGAKAVGAGLRVGGRAAQAVTRPLISVIDRVGEVASEALGTKLDSVRNVAAGTGISGLALGVPGVSQAAAVIGGVEAVSKLGRVAEQAGEQLLQAPTRIGPLESIGRAPNATSIDRALGRVGRFGGDDLIDIGTRSLAGAVEGATIGGLLGGLSQGEEGFAAGIGSGGVLGASAAGLVRGVQKASGVAARQARENDYQIFRDGLDEADQSKFDTIVKNSGINGAVQVMDTAGIIRGKFNDAEIRFLTSEEFTKEHGANARGVKIVNVEAQRPVVKINVDKIGSERTAFHELFHVFKAIDNLRPAAEKVERTIVGNWIINKNGDSVQTSPGFMDEAQILSRFDEYASKLADNDPARKINTVAEKAAFVGEELASEYMSKMIAGSSTDSMLRGFDDFTRTVVDRALLNNNEGFLRRTAQSLGLGSKPIESLLFNNLQEASPALNAQLRDMVRMRRNMDKKLELADEVQVTNLQKKDLSNPVAAQLAIEMNIAEKGADGVTRMKLDDVMSQEDRVSLDSLKSAIKSTPVADVNEPRMRELDGKISGVGISDAQLAAIQSSPNVLDKVKQSFAVIKSAMDNGEALYIRNGAATKKIKSRLTGKTLTRYNDGVRIKELEGVPYSLAENKAGELYLNIFNLSKARQNAMDLASKDRLGPYQADFQAFYGDLIRYLNNLSDPVNRVPSKELLGDAEKAAYLTDFFGQKEGDGKASKFIRSLTLDRMVEMRPTGERVRMTELAYDLNKARFMPAENLGETKVFDAPDSGFRIISKSNNKHSLYAPTGERVGIYDTQAAAERKANQINFKQSTEQSRFMPDVELGTAQSIRTVGQFTPEERKAVSIAKKKSMETAFKYPEAKRLEIQTDRQGNPKFEQVLDVNENPVVDAKGRPVMEVTFTKVPYDLLGSPKLSKNKDRAVVQAADLLDADARKALKNPKISKGIGWYSRMRDFLQQQFGANIEVFGQLLGATSARTPVDTNFKQALEALKMLSTGQYDGLLSEFSQYAKKTYSDAQSGELLKQWQKKNPGKKASAFKVDDETRKQINKFEGVPLRSNGKKYNANSQKVLHVLHGIWLDQTVGPKTPNFAGNLTGRTLKATIDVWAARNLRRLLYEGSREKWRLLPEQESGVTDPDFFFAQDVYDVVAKRIGMNADDLQALMWFMEKDVWEKNGWTNKAGGEKSSFDKEAGKLDMRRYQAGVTTFKDVETFSTERQATAAKEIRSAINGLSVNRFKRGKIEPGSIAARVTHTEGLYGGTTEPSLDVEFSLQRATDPLPVLRKIVEIASRSENLQNDVFLSKIVDKNHVNARPGVEVGFARPANEVEIKDIMEVFRANGIDGFTVARDTNGNAIGIRTQYIPEISGLYDATHLDPNNYLAKAQDWMNKSRAAKKTLQNEIISYAKETYFSTHVVGREEYARALPKNLLGVDIANELGRRKRAIAGGERDVFSGVDTEQSTVAGGYRTSRGNDAGALTADASQAPRPEITGQRFMPDTPESKFYSSRIISAVENSSQGKANGSQWKATIKNSKLGVNQDEYALVGVGDLEDGKTYTKAEVLDYLRANEVVVKDVTLGEELSGDLKERFDALQTRNKDLTDEIAENRRRREEGLITLEESRKNASRLTTERSGLEDEMNALNKQRSKTHFSEYTLPGAKEGSYREVLLTVPEKNTRQEKLDAITEKSNRLLAGRSVSQLSKNELDAYSMFESDFNKIADNRNESGSWRDGHDQYSGIPNPIVRLRTNERTTADGKRMLFIEEIQAPQKGQFEKMPALFQKNWREIAFKWALRTAADNGFDSVGYTTGEQQAARYSLEKQLSSLDYWKDGNDYGIQAIEKNGETVALREEAVSLARIEALVGKEMAKRIGETATDKPQRIESDGLKIGGEGLKKLYDQDFRNVVNNLPVVKKSGQKVGMVEIVTQDQKMVESPINVGEPTFERSQLTTPVHAINVTPEMRNVSVSFMPEVKFSAPEKLPNGQAWSTDMNYRVIQKTGGKFRVYAPIGTLIGVAESLEQAKRLIEKRNK